MLLSTHQGINSVYGRCLHLLEYPEMACTINLVPSLLSQLRGYTERGASDRFLDVSRKPADGLDEADGDGLGEVAADAETGSSTRRAAATVRTAVHILWRFAASITTELSAAWALRSFLTAISPLARSAFPEPVSRFNLFRSVRNSAALL